MRVTKKSRPIFAESSSPLVRRRLGVVVDHPIQYFSPLFDELTRRARVDFCVAYGNDHGLREAYDAGFGTSHSWDIDLTQGHQHEFITTGTRSHVKNLRAFPKILRFVKNREVLVIHGYADPVSLAAVVCAVVTRTPYLLRSDTSVRNRYPQWDPRHWVPRAVSRLSAGGLSAGSRNETIQRDLGVPQVYFAPFSVDNSRFALGERRRISDHDGLRAQWGLDATQPVIGYCGKLVEHKGIDDLVAAIRDLAGAAQLFLIGDGPLREYLESEAIPQTVISGFVNQSRMPEALAACDIIVLPSYTEPWGLAVNEAMAAGCFPVVSDAVGCAPDLVQDVGIVFPAGDREALSKALRAALDRFDDPASRLDVRTRVEEFDISKTADGYEAAVASVISRSS